MCYSFCVSFKSIGEFILTESNVRIKPRGKIYSINEGYSKYWYNPIRDYIAGLKNPKVCTTKLITSFNRRAEM